MKPMRKKQPLEAPSGLSKFEKLLLCVTLGLIVLRLTIVEAPHIDTVQIRPTLSPENISLLLSGCVLLCGGLWFLAAVFSGRLRWRRTSLAPAVGLFIAAGIIAACFASNKRTAVTDLAMLAAPMLSALMLVQWLRSAAAIRLALLLILAVGVAATVQCVDQKAQSNTMLVAEYEADPAEHLEKLGIEPESMEHWMYEHRLYSKDIRGFLMTSNSAATFFLLALCRGRAHPANTV